MKKLISNISGFFLVFFFTCNQVFFLRKIIYIYFFPILDDWTKTQHLKKNTWNQILKLNCSLHMKVGIANKSASYFTCHSSYWTCNHIKNNAKSLPKIRVSLRKRSQTITYTVKSLNFVRANIRGLLQL